MSHETINSWVEKANGEPFITMRSDDTLVIKSIDPKNKGWAIMKIAETLFPCFIKLFEGKRDNNGMFMHPARIRAIALNVAQGIVSDQDQKNANA